MLAGFRRILITTLILGLWAFITVIGLRQLGLQQRFEAHKHPLLQQENIVVSEEAKVPGAWLKVDLRLTKDQHWVVFKHKFLEENSNGRGHVELTTLEEFKALQLKNGKTPVSFAEFYEKFNSWPVVIFLHSNEVLPLRKLIETIEKYDGGQRVVIQSSYQTPLKKMREKRPLWLYGITSSDFSKLRLFTGLFLEPVLSFRGDIVISPEHKAYKKGFLPRMVDEIHRRGGKVLLRADQLPSTDQTKVGINYEGVVYDGVLTHHPALFVEAFQRNK